VSIAGIGTDIVDTQRIGRLVERHGDRLPGRILTARELAQCARSGDATAFVARRFAAKEATAKALGTGMARGVRFGDIQIDHDARGRPKLELFGSAHSHAATLGVSEHHLSISDEQYVAIAFVVLWAG